MVQTWHTASAGRFSCPHCGSIYDKFVYRSPARDKDEATCRVCGNVMDSWNSTTIPSFTLVKDASTVADPDDQKNDNE